MGSIICNTILKIKKVIQQFNYLIRPIQFLWDRQKLITKIN